MICDVAIAGGGPAGLAAAARLAERGFHAVVVERAAAPVDKACGEGLMPRGLRQLEALGALALLDRSRTAPFEGIRYLQEDGAAVEARFHGGGGLGVRRVALAEALWTRASSLGAERIRGALKSFRIDGGAVHIETDAGSLEARLLVGADGLGSSVRRLSGLDAAPPEPRRFGIRRHYAVAPWSPFVEVHWQAGAEAYVTPIGPGSINVAVLWDAGAAAGGAGFELLLARFPALAARLAGAPTESEARGAGPLWRPVRARVADRVALVGDAAGYVDAITGQGLSLALEGAALLARSLPRQLDGPALRSGLLAYQSALRRGFRGYALPAAALLALARRPELRRRALRLLSARPGLFRFLLRAVD